MATKQSQNPFQQFVSGLFGNMSSTPMKTTTPSVVSPISSSKTTTSPFGLGKTNQGRDIRIGTTRSWLDPANAVAERANTPFIPSTPSGGGMSVAPNSTSALTGKPAATGISGVINPKADPGYVPPSTSKPSVQNTTPTAVKTGVTASTYSAPAASSGSTAGQSTGFSYASPGGYTGGGGTAPNDYRKAYTDMLASLYSTRDLKEANENLDKLNRQAADAQLFSREEERRIRENEQGQGYKTFAGDLRENTRKSTAELADLAIASSPFQEYIKNAMTAAREMYGVGRDETTDARNATQDALAERKFKEDVRQFGLRYALDQQQEARLGRESGELSKDDYVAQYAQAFTPGTVMADGTPTIDENGFINPKAFKEAAAEAAQYGITRKEFIQMFGSMLYTDEDGIPDPSYGLTNVEKKLIVGTIE